MTKVSIVDLIAKKMKRCIAIVEDGDTASQSIASGKFVIWKGNPYKASTAISAGDTLSTSNLTALSDGIGNELNSNLANKQDTISLQSVSNVASGLTVMRNGYFTIGNLVVLNVVFKATSGSWTADTALFSVPAAYEGDAPLTIFSTDTSPNNPSARCRISSGYVRPGISLTLNKEYVIQGTYFKNT